MTDHSDLQWNNEDITRRLKSAMDVLTPNVLDKIDLNTPQEIYREKSKVMKLYSKMRTVAVAAAACLCIALLGGGVAKFQNSRVDSIIGIDVNPSIELSVNRNDKILKANPLNADAKEILDDMELKNVDLNIAVNAVIGSMVRHGYLDEVENAILVTVSNDDREKASALRQDVVVDIEKSLEEHKVTAVVYDQEASVRDEVKQLAEEYGISYGKAYFLQELVAGNDLNEEDLKVFAGMTMEEIAQEITERSYHIGKDKEEEEENSLASKEETAKTEKRQSEEASLESSAEESTEQISSERVEESVTIPPSTAPTEPPSTSPSQESAETEESAGSGGTKAKIDYVDYDGGFLNVVFKDKVKWKNPTISVKDDEGVSYSAKITDTSSGACEIEVKGLPGGRECTFVLGGVSAKDGGTYGSIKGYFDTPDIADDVTDAVEDETEEEESSGSPVIPPEESMPEELETGDVVVLPTPTAPIEETEPAAQTEPSG